MAGSLFSKLNLWRNSHMLHTQTTQAHIDRVGELWTIAAAAAKKNHPWVRVPLVHQLVLLCLFFYHHRNQPELLRGFEAKKLNVYIIFLPIFIHCSIWLGFLDYTRGSPPHCKSLARENVKSGLDAGQYIGQRGTHLFPLFAYFLRWTGEAFHQMLQGNLMAIWLHFVRMKGRRRGGGGWGRWFGI